MATGLQSGRFGDRGDTLQGYQQRRRMDVAVNDGSRPQRLNRNASQIGRGFDDAAKKAYERPGQDQSGQDSLGRRTRQASSDNPLAPKPLFDRVTQTRAQWRDKALRKGIQGGLGDQDISKFKTGPRGEADRPPTGLFPGDRDVTRQVGQQTASVFGGTTTTPGGGSAPAPTPSQAEAAERARVASEQAAQQRQREAEAEAQRQRDAEAEAQRQRDADAQAQRERDAAAEADRQRRKDEARANGTIPPWGEDPDERWIFDGEGGWLRQG